MFEAPDRDDLIEQAGGLAANVAVLLIGVAIGATWIALEVQATGCVSEVGVTGACSMLPAAEAWTMRAVGVAVLLFVGAFGAEYHGRGVEE